MNTIVKRFTTFLMLTLLALTASSQKSSKFQTPSSSQDSIPALSTYQTSLINLNFNSMMYWYDTATRLERLYNLQSKKIEYYAKITGVQAGSVASLEEAYKNKRAIQQQLEDELDAQMNSMREEMRNLKTNNIILSLTMGTLAVTTGYLLIFK